MSEQLRVLGLAMVAFIETFEDKVRPVARECRDLAEVYCLGLWTQFDEDLITPSEFINKLTSEMQKVDDAIVQMAAIGIINRANRFSWRFARDYATPIARKLLGVQSKDLDWNFSKSNDNAYTFCLSVSEKLRARNGDEMAALAAAEAAADPE